MTKLHCARRFCQKFSHVTRRLFALKLLLVFEMSYWIDYTKPGVSKDFAGGKLYRIPEGARFTDAMGVSVVISKERPDYNGIAHKSPALARYWSEKYKFVPNTPDYEYDKKTMVDDHLSFYDSLSAALRISREKEAEIRKKISQHPGVRKNFSCVNVGIEIEEGALAEIKNLCEELIKSAMDHQENFKKMEKIKGELDARGKNDLKIPQEDLIFARDFSPFVFKFQPAQ